MYSDEMVERCYNYYSPQAQAALRQGISELDALLIKFPEGKVINGIFYVEGEPALAKKNYAPLA